VWRIEPQVSLLAASDTVGCFQVLDPKKDETLDLVEERFERLQAVPRADNGIPTTTYGPVTVS
jgi:hypothetical protein